MPMNQKEKAAHFLVLHDGDTPLLMPNPWDAGSAKLFAWMGFDALATTSSGFAATLGRLDGDVTREEAIAHGNAVADAVDVPVSADLENCFADDPEGVADTIGLAIGAGLAGCSVEDSTKRSDDPIYDAGLARERVAAATDAAHAGPVHFVITARAEGYLHGRRDLGEIISRLQSFQEAGADVLFAPGVTDIGEIKTLVASVDRPVNVLAFPGMSGVEELAAAGVRRISVGGAFAYAAYAGAAAAAHELLDQGTFGYTQPARDGAKALRAALAAASASSASA